MHFMDKVEDFVEVRCSALNCILKFFPRPGLFSKKVGRNQQIIIRNIKAAFSVGMCELAGTYDEDKITR